MKSRAIPFSQIAGMPTIHLFASPACNLRCPYCSQIDVRTAKQAADALSSVSLLKALKRWVPTHIYLSGGEPFYHSSLPAFLKAAHGAGHVVSLDTNGVIDLTALEKLLEPFPSSFWGFFNISHHLLADVSLEYLLKRVAILKRRQIRHFIKYIAVPDSIPEIMGCVDRLSAQEVGWAVTSFQTYKQPWKLRHFPQDYTIAELRQLLDQVTFASHGLQFFGGFRPMGRACRGGTNVVAYNQDGQNRITACCHRNDDLGIELDRWDTIPGPSSRPCNHSSCLGDLMMMLGFHGIAEETQSLEQVCAGHAAPLGLERVLRFCENVAAHAPIVNRDLFDKIVHHRKRGGGRHDVSSKATKNPVSQAILNQKERVAAAIPRLTRQATVIASPCDLAPYQWGQLMALTLEFKPGLIVEIGRGKGSTTALFAEAANVLTECRTKVLSICPSLEWDKRTGPQLVAQYGAKWMRPLKLVRSSIGAFLDTHGLPAASRVIVFWREAGLETAAQILGRLLPEIQETEHIVIFHGATDARYQGMQESFTYAPWSPENGQRMLQLGTIMSQQPQLISIYEFVSRNGIGLHSAEHDLRTGPLSRQTVRDDVADLWGHAMMSLQAHWYWFSLNEKDGTCIFPDCEARLPAVAES